jgi:tight adherence protein C
VTDYHALITALLAAAAVLMAGGAMLFALRGMEARSLERRVLSAANVTAPQDLEAAESLGLGQRLLRWVGETIRGRTRFYSERDLLALEGMLAAGGFNPRKVLPVVLGAKAVLAVAVPASVLLYGRLADATGSREFLMICIAIPLGLLGPEWLLTFLRRPYLTALRTGVPDALDLLVVCSEAGMGLESALERVSLEMRHSNPAIAGALGKLLDEMRILPDRRDAFRNFADRTGVEGARRVATMLGQSIQYGTPLSQALRTVAIDLRRERILALEAKAVRLPALLVLPLVVFIMPSLFIVLTGPAVLRLLDTLHSALVLHH